MLNVSMQENNHLERFHLLVPFPELITSVNGVVALSELILKEGGEQNNKLDEQINWVKRRYQTFDAWAAHAREIGKLNGNNSSSEEQSIKIIAAFDGIETVVAESKNVSKCLANSATGDDRFDQLIDVLEALERHYAKARGYLDMIEKK